LAGSESKKAESRSNYEKSQAPKTTYKSPTGKEVPIDTKSKATESLRNDLNQDKWVNRSSRTTTVYNTYITRPNYAPMYYSDPFHPALNYWLLSQTIDTMALMVYHHHTSMDAARLQYLYAQNAGLQAKVNAREAQKLSRDPSYVPMGMERDLLYSDEYVDAVYNPSPRMVDVEREPISFHGFWVFLKWCFFLVVIAVVLYGVCYVLFIHRWGI